MGFDAPNYTQVPNYLLDELIQDLTGLELKVLLIIIRKTIGWHKKREKISLSTFEKILQSDKKHISGSINSLIEKGYIIKILEGENGQQQTFYELKIKEIPTGGEMPQGGVAKCHGSPAPLYNDIKEKELKKAEQQYARTREADLEKSAKTAAAFLNENEKKNFDEVKSWGVDGTDKQIVDWIREHPIEKLRAAKEKALNKNCRNLGAFIAHLLKTNFTYLSEGIQKCLKFCEEFMNEMRKGKISPWHGFVYDNEEFYAEYKLNGTVKRVSFTENYEEFKKYLWSQYKLSLGI